MALAHFGLIPAQPMPVRTVNFDQRIKEIDMFFEGRDKVHRTMVKLLKKLAKAEIPYALAGGMAVNAHKYRRTTEDVDVLLTVAGFEAFKRLFVPKVYPRIDGRPRRFLDPVHKVTFDILLTGRYPGSGRPGPIAFPDPAAVSEMILDRSVLQLATLIELKLAARRYRDFGDVVELIRFNELDESFQDRLHSSVRGDYIECLEEKRREDDYEAREDRDVAEEFPDEPDES